MSDIGDGTTITIKLDKPDALELLEAIEGAGDDGSFLVELEQTAIDFVYNDKPKPQPELTVEALTWFDRTYGNTYHSARAYLDGELVAVVPFQYGYDDHYLTTALEELVKAGVLPDLRYDNGNKYGLRQTCEAQGWMLSYSKHEALKRVVTAYGEAD